MKLPHAAQFLVFTDLDGSLLDHHSYSYQDALPQLRKLEVQNIPVIPVSSKTRVEIEQLREELGNEHPFIVENGAAVLIPEGYFDTQPPGSVTRAGYWVCEMSAPRDKWLQLLQGVARDFAGDFESFHSAGVEGIMRMTNLSRERAELANTREYSEPVKWFGDQQRQEIFIQRLQAAGAGVLQGGRFLSVCGDCDKGKALQWLRDVYVSARPEAVCHTLAIGDSRNDCAMLEAADCALVIRSTVHDFPVLRRTHGVSYSEGYGPAGWAQGVASWLHQQQQTDKL